MHLSHSIPVLFFSALAHARTDLTGCTTTDVSSPAGASYAWIVPGTGELCDFLDCGGGRAPPKTTVQGCPAYVGTETYKPSFLAGFGVVETAGVMATTAAPTFTTSAAASTATATVAMDDGTDAEDEDGDTEDESDANDGTDADDIDDFYDLMITYPTGWNDWTPEQQANWWSSYGYNSAAITTGTMTGASTSSQESMATSSASSVSSSTSNSAISITNSALTSTPSTKDLPTLAAASTTSALMTASISMTRSWVKTIPTFSRAAADVEDHRASVSASTSASLVDSTGAAGKVGCVFGGAGVFAAVVGVLAVLQAW
ncbi:hypothetical protein KCU65_g2447, partial [Aureobasidium melanogenum]